MACRLVSRYVLRCLAKHPSVTDCGLPCLSSRTFSSYDERIPPNRNVYLEIISHDSSFVWPDTRLGTLEPKDRRFPLPGLVGSNSPDEPRHPRKVTKGYDADVLTAELPHERQSTILEQFATINSSVSKDTKKSENILSPFDCLDCVAQECPYFLKKDFQHLFPNQDLMNQNLTVITFSQKIKETKFEDAVSQFVEAATDMCEAFHSAGFWADFVEPTSGQPYLTSHVNALSYETDKRYRQFGFEVIIQGGCKVLDHHHLGTKPFIGCIITTTPPHHPLILQLHKLS